MTDKSLVERYPNIAMHAIDILSVQGLSPEILNRIEAVAGKKPSARLPRTKIPPVTTVEYKSMVDRITKAYNSLEVTASSGRVIWQGRHQGDVPVHILKLIKVLLEDKPRSNEEAFVLSHYQISLIQYLHSGSYVPPEKSVFTLPQHTTISKDMNKFIKKVMADGKP